MRLMRLEFIQVLRESVFNWRGFTLVAPEHGRHRTLNSTLCFATTEFIEMLGSDANTVGT